MIRIQLTRYDRTAYGVRSELHRLQLHDGCGRFSPSSTGAARLHDVTTQHITWKGYQQTRRRRTEAPAAIVELVTMQL